MICSISGVKYLCKVRVNPVDLHSAFKKIKRAESSSVVTQSKYLDNWI